MSNAKHKANIGRHSHIDKNQKALQILHTTSIIIIIYFKQNFHTNNSKVLKKSLPHNNVSISTEVPESVHRFSSLVSLISRQISQPLDTSRLITHTFSHIYCSLIKSHALYVRKLKGKPSLKNKINKTDENQRQRVVLVMWQTDSQNHHNNNTNNCV